MTDKRQDRLQQLLYNVVKEVLASHSDYHASTVYPDVPKNQIIIYLEILYYNNFFFLFIILEIPWHLRKLWQMDCI